jgi:hypothetical protein
MWKRLLLISVAVVATLSQSLASVVSRSERAARVVNPSSILQELSDKRAAQPDISWAELASHANKLLDEKGFDYDFDVCEILKRRRNLPDVVKTRYQLTQTNGKSLPVTFLVLPNDGFCGECGSAVPSLKVTRTEMLIVLEGKRYSVKRPASFLLDEAFLVDASMKKVRRTWQLPFQTVPDGISPDGTKLYVTTYSQELEGLVVELSEDGTMKFRSRAELQLTEPEWLEKHPKDSSNAYLAFLRLKSGKKSYIVRFTAPCT